MREGRERESGRGTTEGRETITHVASRTFIVQMYVVALYDLPSMVRVVGLCPTVLAPVTVWSPGHRGCSVVCVDTQTCGHAV